MPTILILFYTVPKNYKLFYWMTVINTYYKLSNIDKVQRFCIEKQLYCGQTILYVMFIRLNS